MAEEVTGRSTGKPERFLGLDRAIAHGAGSPILSMKFPETIESKKENAGP